MGRGRWVAALLMMWAMAAGAGEVVLLDDTRQAVIVVPDKLDGLTREGLVLLQETVARSTTVTLASVAEKEEAAAEGPRLLLGRSVEVDARLGAVLDGLTEDGFVIDAEGETVIVAGRTPLADRSAAQEFLRRYCGARWYMPGPLWEVVKQQRTLAVPAGRSTIEPSYRSRWHSGMNTVPMTAANFRWMNVQGAARRDDFHHAYLHYFSAKQYGAAHPEYYSEVNGKRQVPGPGSMRGWQICMTNPAMVEEYAKIAADHFRRQPQMSSISVSPNDGGVFCECAGCKPLWGDPADEMSGQSRLVFNLANAVARRLAVTHPDKLVGILGYSGYRLPAPGLKVEPNVIVYVVGCRSGLGDPEKWAAYEESLQAWKRAGVRHFGLYEWHHGSFFVVPPIYPRVLAKAMKYGAEQGASGWYSEDYPCWGLQGPAHWIVRRLLWDVNQDVEALLDDYCTNLFGSAAPAMRDYFDRCEQQWTANSTGGGMANDGQFAAYPPDVRAELRGLLDRALAATEREEPAHQRVRFFADSFGLSERMAATHESGAAALAAVEAGHVGEALAHLGGAGGPSRDPLLYLQLVLDQWPGAYYTQSVSADQDFAVGMRAAVEARIKLAGPIATEAGQTVLAEGAVTADAYRKALAAAFGKRLPATQTAAMQDAVAAVREYAGKAVFAPEAATAPALDGKLDDPAWQEIPDQTGFHAYGSGLPARYETRFRLVRHGDWLYGAFTCYQDMTRPKASAGVRDGPVWLDDAIEIFLNRPDATAETDFFQAIVNLDGTIFDQLGKKASWDGELKVGTAREDDRWVLEIGIPLSAIGMAGSDCRGLRLNVVRDVWGPGPGKAAQISPWFPTTFGHADLQLRGWVFFPGATP